MASAKAARTRNIRFSLATGRDGPISSGTAARRREFQPIEGEWSPLIDRVGTELRNFPAQFRLTAGNFDIKMISYLYRRAS
ncbi:hypothetical protein LH20_01070 [Sphingopyxis sp. 113P3]|nr:hypothetical protein LH20_01070 [Sphingopyxis sp. 113P3]